MLKRLAAGAACGVASAAMIDFAAFRSWKKWDDALVYDWRTASFRWVQGAVVGMVTALGLVGLDSAG